MVEIKADGMMIRRGNISEIVALEMVASYIIDGTITGYTVTRSGHDLHINLTKPNKTKGGNKK